MAQNHHIQYYVDGSAVRKIEPEMPKKQHKRLPKPRKRRQSVVYYDPLAMVSLAVTAVMLILLVAGFVTMLRTHAEVTRMETQITQLRQENAQLQKEYQSGYDLEDIQQKAEALGLIPEAEAQSVTIHVEVPEPEPVQPTFWEQVAAFFGSLFA